MELHSLLEYLFWESSLNTKLTFQNQLTYIISNWKYLNLIDLSPKLIARYNEYVVPNHTFSMDWTSYDFWLTSA